MLRLGIFVLFCVFSVPGVLSYTRPQFYTDHADVLKTIQPRSANRLLNNTEPLHYGLELTTNIQNQQTVFNGIINIRFRPLEQITRIRVNSFRLTIISCTLYNRESGVVPLTSRCVAVDRFLDAVAQSPLEANQEYTLQVTYTGLHRSPSEGFHYSYYTVNGQNRYLASTQFQSVFAREAFPCFDEPYYRVPIKLTIRHDPTLNALANAEIESTMAGVTVFKETWQMPSYLIAFVVSDFQCTTKFGKQRICAQPNRMNEVSLAMGASDKILAWMEATFDEEYEHEKLDHIAIPTFQFGGMENWGLVVYHPAFLLYKEGVSTVNDRINVASVISHELAHMFYGNLVTPKWWTYLWLSEGLATLYEFYGTHAAFPEMRMDEQFTVNALHAAFRADQTGSSRPMTYYVDSVNGIEAIFDTISYLKAGSIFRMIKYALGEATFHKALQKFLNENKNSGVDEKPMYKALEEAIAEDRTAPVGIIASVMDSWSLQGGYPVVTVTRNYANGGIHLSQLEFITQTHPVTSTKVWGIPISFTQKTGANFDQRQANLWMQTREQEVANDVSANDWVIFNLLQSGYYRVNYDNRNWEQLIEELRTGNLYMIPPTNRAQMISDINYLADYGQVGNTLRFSLMEYLSRETDMIPLQAARLHMRALNRMMASSPQYYQFKRYMTRMVEWTFKGVEQFFFWDEDVNTMESRTVLIDLACTAGVAECLAMTRTLMFAELRSKSEVINREDRAMIYCHGLKTASPRTFGLFMNTYDKLYNHVEWPTEELGTVEASGFINMNLLNRVIGCYGNTDAIQDQLRQIFSEEFHYPRHRFEILNSIIVNGHLEEVLNFLVDNIRQFKDLNIGDLEEVEFGASLTRMSEHTFSQAQSDKLTAFLDVIEPDYEAPKQVLDNLKDNLLWFARHGKELEVFLGQRYADVPASAMTFSMSIAVLLIAFLVSILL